ncbi:xanthine dehydrogenase family protein molybdopterin-binding subunit [Gayadomonas joobiniege]|uniref:xanthine dehydrogenase family protein molybdopterin-binding subunit n=1 Tax=Gayadomonas joobiniege TaxID=1234606 RepID=UPI00037DE502|nr:molybdopterin cofactor-binding domain-containing protein [Gayadomonas joobiniege]
MSKSTSVNIVNLSRRQLLKASAGAGLLFSLKCRLAHAATETAQKSELNLFVNLYSDNQLEILCNRSEMGQGIRVSFAQIIADEMYADWQYVSVQQSIGDKRTGNQNTDGSRSIRLYYNKLRLLGASALYMLKAAAAQLWQVPVTQLTAQKHYIIDTRTGRKAAFGELAELAAKQSIPDEKSLTLKSKEQFEYIGKGITSIDFNPMVNGRAEFGQDVMLPNMLYACLKRSPVLSSEIEAYDDSECKKINGVKQVLTLGSGAFPAHFNPLPAVAVLAEHTWAAIKGVRALKVDWKQTDYHGYHSDTDLHYKTKNLTALNAKQRAQKKPDTPLPNDLNQFSATYVLPYLAHAPMEPPAASAVFHSESNLEIWACVQSPQAVQQKAAQITGLDEKNIRVNVTFLGGAFGRKAQPDFVMEAVILARQTGQPVKVIWQREDDIQHDYYHAASITKHTARYQHQRIHEWQAETCFTPIPSLFNINKTHPSGGEMQDLIRHNYAIDSQKTLSFPYPAQTRIAWLRSVANIQHGFSIGCFMDEMAHQMQIDPVEHWQHLLAKNDQNKGLNAALKQVYQSSGWSQKSHLPAGEALGIALHHSFASDIAVVSHVSVKDNKLLVKKVYISAHVGTWVNEDRVTAQMEGSVIFGLSIALFNKISFKDGAVEQSNFNDYQVVRINQAPEIHVDLVPSEAQPGGVGEPGLPPVAPSIVNAIFAATGQRHRQLPLNQFYQV